MKNKDLKLSLIFALVGIAAGAFTSMYQIEIYDQATKDAVISQLGSLGAIHLLSAVQTGIIAFICSFVGLKLLKRTGFNLNFRFDKNSFITACIVAFSTALIISVSEKLIFAPHMREVALDYKFNFIYFLSSILYGGIIEELMLRLFIMSLLVFLLKKFASLSSDENIPNWMYIVAIIVSSILFAAGHLPAAAQMFGLSVLMVTRILILNGIGGLGFGYLYWKKGLGYSMLAHMLTHIFNQLILLPLFF
jgi:membrane protease YdiL (CAAX protease family)